MLQHKLSRLLSREQLTQGVKRLAGAVRSDYWGQCPLLVGVLKGSFVFLADLVREVNMPLTVEFVRVQSYQHTASTGRMEISSSAPMEVRERQVLVVEDIVDTGTTVAHLMEWLQKDGPASLRLCPPFGQTLPPAGARSGRLPGLHGG